MLKVFVAWLASDLSQKAQNAIAANSPEELRRIKQLSDHADQIWQSWATANDGSVISCEPGQGVLEIGPEKLKDIMGIHNQYSQAIGGSACIGIGTRMNEALAAAKSALERGTDQIAFFSAEQQGPGLAKQEPDAPVSIPQLPVAVPIKQRLCDLADKQHQQDEEMTKRQSNTHDETKSKLAMALQAVKDQMPALIQLKQVSPETYASIMSLLGSVIDMGRAIKPHHVVVTPTSEE